MTLRMRIAAVAGGSGALAGLRERARPFTRPPPGGGDGGALGGAEGPGPKLPFGSAPPPPGPPSSAGGAGGFGQGGLPSNVQPAPFGGASGYVAFFGTNGVLGVA